MKLKKHCCEKYKRKAKACKGCPIAAGLSKSERRKWLKKAAKKRKKAG